MRFACILFFSLAVLSANPLLQFSVPIPWDQIQPTHIAPAIDQHLKTAAKRRAELGALRQAPSWDNTIEALELITRDLNLTWELISHLQSVNNSPELRKVFNEVEPRVVRFNSELSADPAIFARVKRYAATAEAKLLSGPRRRLLDLLLDDYRRSGVALPARQRARVLDLKEELSKLESQFAQNALDSMNAFEHFVESEAEVAGLPETAKAAAKASAKAKGRDGYRFTLQAPSLIPVLQYADNASLREKLSRAQSTIATAAPHDNRPVLARILVLRRELAGLLGYANFADYQVEQRMAKSGGAVQAFLAKLESQTNEAFARETAAIKEFRKSLEGEKAPELRTWDVAYYTQKLRQQEYAFDQDVLRPYFELNRTLKGLFELAQKLYGIEVVERKDIPVWHPQVRAYRIREADGRELATFYADFFPRESKRSGAWMNNLYTSITGGDPHIGLIAGNLTPPDEKGVSLLTHIEVTTLFHEFGHLLHLALAEGPVRPLNGTNVAWDFVELPSQIMENFVWEKKVLDTFAVHHETGEALPEELFQKMTRARTFAAAAAQMRQLSLGTMDIQLHTAFRPNADYGDPVSYSRNLAQRFNMAPIEPEACPICNFTHIFAGGYAAGYYSYKWAEVLDADAFSKFKEAGVVSREVGSQFRSKVLSRGNNQPASELFRAFMGRDPDPTALLKRAGLLKR